MVIIALFIVGNHCLVHQTGTKLTRFKYSKKGTSPLLRHSKREKDQIKDFRITSDAIRNVIRVGTGSSILLSHPSIASAVADPSAQKALQLLSGYQTRTPYFITWGMLAVLVYALAFEVWKKWLAAW
jgi:hypothetical protein